MAYDRDVYEKTEYVREENVKEDVCSVVEQGMWRIRIKQELYVCVCVCVCVYIYIYIYICIYTGCPRRNVPDFGRMFLILKYTDITQNTYIQS